MAENTKIEWCHHTFNCWRGCTKVSEACRHCYAETLSGRNPKTLGVWGPNGTRVVASEAMWREPLKWNKAAVACPDCGNDKRTCGHWPTNIPIDRPRVFCASLADVFEDWSGPMVDSKGEVLDSDRSRKMTATAAGLYDPLGMNDVRHRLFTLIDATPNLDWLLLTKRPENVLRFAFDAWCKKVPGHVSQNEGDGRTWSFPPNVWIGTTVENQAAADERIPHLLRVPAAVRFLSCEPLLGPVDLSEWMYTIRVEHNGDGDTQEVPCKPDIHWVIAGGESGPGARPMHPDWARSLRDQCVAAGVAFHFKQWGDWGDGYAGMPRTEAHKFGQKAWDGVEPILYQIGKKKAGRLLDGRTWDELPRVG